MYWILMIGTVAFLVAVPYLPWGIGLRVRNNVPPVAWLGFAILATVAFLLFGLFSGTIPRALTKNMPRRLGSIHNEIVLHQGDVPKLVRGEGVRAEGARMGMPEIHEYDVPLKRPFYFSDNGHPETIFSDLQLHKGDYLEITVSGPKVKCIADCPTYVFPLVGPDGGNTIANIKDPSQKGKFAFPGGRQGCVVGQIGTGVKYDDAGIPYVVGKHPDPFAVGRGPVIVQVPENGARLYLMMNLRWMPESWDDVDDAVWHVTVRKFSP